jgi:hypothetical protein
VQEEPPQGGSSQSMTVLPRHGVDNPGYQELSPRRIGYWRLSSSLAIVKH